MRVICIDEDAFPNGVERYNEEGKIKTGETYEVTDVFFSEGYVWYVVSIDIGYGYWENAFARTSDVSETEFERNFKKELV